MSGSDPTSHAAVTSGVMPTSRTGLRRVLSLFIALAAAGLAGLSAWTLIPPEYNAFSLIRISSSEPGVLRHEADSLEAFPIFKRTQAEMLRSPVVIHAALRAPKVGQLPMIAERGDDAAEWLSEELSVSFPGNAEVMRIGLKGKDPASLQRVVNAVVEAYLKEIVSHEKEVRLEQRTRLEQSYMTAVREVRRDMELLHKMEKVQGVSGSPAAQLEKRLAHVQLDEKMSARAQLGSALRRNKLEIELAEAGRKDSKDASETSRPLPLLVKEQEHLENAMSELSREIADGMNSVRELEKFSAEATAKREELAQRVNIANQIRTELNSLEVEALAAPRITRLDAAQLPSSRGDFARRRVLTICAGLAGFVIVWASLSRFNRACC